MPRFAPRFARALALLAVAAALVACAKLPDPVPYRANVREKGGGSNGTYRINELDGAELALDGQVLGKLSKDSSKVHVVLDWSGPRADVKKVMNGTYTLALTGACGPFSHPVDGTPPLWRKMSERELVKAMGYEKKVPVFLELSMPKTFPVYIDWGKARGVLKIGAVTVEAGKANVAVVVEGCTAAPTVTLDGAPLGTIDLSAKGALVTLEPGVCHVHQQVGYGSQQATKPSVYFPAQAVLPLAELPPYFLQSAPSSLNLYAGSKGTVTSELLRARCR